MGEESGDGVGVCAGEMMGGGLVCEGGGVVSAWFLDTMDVFVLFPGCFRTNGTGEVNVTRPDPTRQFGRNSAHLLYQAKYSYDVRRAIQ